MRYVLILMGITFTALLQAQTPGAWTLKNEKDGVKVYLRKTSDIYEIKLASSFKTSLSGLASILSEVDKFETWGYKVSQVRLISQVSPTEFYYYARLDFPWPLADRDVVMHTKLHQDPVTLRVYSHSKSEPDLIPPVANVIRIREAHTKWTLFPGTNGWVYTEYEIYTDPGGNIPDWIVNLAIDIGLRETMNNIRNFLKETRYQNIKLAYIQN
jgi:hypothetical protein